MTVTIYQRLLLAKIETTIGTDAAPVPASDAIRFKSCKFGLTPDIVQNPAVKQTMGPLPHLIGGKSSMGLEIEVALKSSGAAGTVSEVGKLLNVCGLLQTIVAATSVAYDPLSNVDSHKTGTFYWYEDGLLWKFIAAIGKHTFDAKIGEAGGFKFSISAPYLAPTAIACPTGAVYQASNPIVMSSADIFNDGAVIKVGAFSLDDGNEVTQHYVTGLNDFDITNRTPKMKLTKDSVSTISEWTSLMSIGNVALSATFGSVAGSRLIVTAPVGRRDGLNLGQRVDRNTLEMSYGLYESAGDDQFKYLFN
jgi:hypothetical protein